VITVRNKSEKYTFTLSDLIVWDKDGKQQVIKKPGFDEAGKADDEELKPEDQRVFVTDFDVVKYFVSTKIGSTEIEWKQTSSVTLIGSTAQMVDPRTGQGLHGETCDDSGAHHAPEPGQMFHFEGGFSPDLPGWFLGRVADLERGEILEPYTGPAQVIASGLETEYAPTPCGPDCTGDGLLNINDFLCMKREFDRKTAFGDYNKDGLWNIRDFLAFQADFSRGCK
jgi:hypothetical protein